MPPIHFEQMLVQAIQHQQAGRLAEAESLLRQILAHDPNQSDALHQLGLLAFQTGHAEAAIDLIRRAIAANPSNPAFHGNLGFIYRSLGKLHETIIAFSAAAALRPGLPEAHFNLGAALEQDQQWEQAITAYRNALDQRPNFPEALNNLANALNAVGRYDEAIAASRQALAIRPAFPESLKTLSSALARKGDLEQSAAALRQVIAMRADDANSHFQLGTTLLELHQPQDAIAAFRTALALRPRYAEAMWNLAFALLLTGNLREGFAAYEARRQMNVDLFHHTFTQPLWDGSDLGGRRILLHPEKGNGFGEVIQFARYASLVANRGGKVILECQPELKSLLSTLPGVEQTVALGEPLPAFDVHCPLMSLAARFDTTLETIPSSIPYLNANLAQVDQWRDKLLGETCRLKVGLVWSGRPHPPGRSIEPQLLAPLGKIQGVRFYSLQKMENASSQRADESRSGSGLATDPQQVPDRRQQCKEMVAAGLSLVDYAPELYDFSDTAALLMNLDLVITIDTAVAHLAGALGRPTWLLLRHAADWRWLMDRADSPWYPSMRIFRQPVPGDWAAVIAQVLRRLAEQ